MLSYSGPSPIEHDQVAMSYAASHRLRFAAAIIPLKVYRPRRKTFHLPAPFAYGSQPNRQHRFIAARAGQLYGYVEVAVWPVAAARAASKEKEACDIGVADGPPFEFGDNGRQLRVRHFGRGPRSVILIGLSLSGFGGATDGTPSFFFSSSATMRTLFALPDDILRLRVRLGHRRLSRRGNRVARLLGIGHGIFLVSTLASGRLFVRIFIACGLGAQQRVGLEARLPRVSRPTAFLRSRLL